MNGLNEQYPLLSVVIPIFRVEKYLSKCVESVLAQTYPNLEIILVDDGSDDACPEICDQFEKNNKNVLAFHKQNGGLSDTRNYGIQKSKGSWVLFLDSDDYLDSDYIESLMSFLFKTQADMVIGGFTNEWEDGTIIRYMGCKSDQLYETKTAMKELCYGDNIAIFACAKIIRRNTAIKYPFPIGKLHEDVATTYKYLMDCSRIAVSSAKGYHYVNRKGSILTQNFRMDSCYALEAANELAGTIAERYPELEKAGNARIAIECNGLLHRAADSVLFPEVKKQVEACLHNRLFLIMLDSRIRFKIRCQLLLFKVNSNLYIRVYHHFRHVRY